MARDSSQPALKKALVYFGTLAATTVIAVCLTEYVKDWLQGVGLEIYRGSTTVAQKGSERVDPDEDVILDVQKVTYKNKTYDSIHVVRFVLFNPGSHRVAKDAECYFFFRSKPIAGDCILGATGRRQESTADLIQFTPCTSEELGKGLRLNSDFPGRAKAQITLVLNTGGSGEELGSASDEIELKWIPKSGESITPKPDPYGGTITLTIWRALLWGTAIACLYGGAWLALNIALGNFSTGAYILDYVLRTVFNWSIIDCIKSRQKRRHRRGRSHARRAEGDPQCTDK